MKAHPEAQAMISGSGAYRSVSGCVRISPMGGGSAVQAHVRGFPCPSDFYGFSVELNGGRRCPLPPLMTCCGEALMSVWTDSFAPSEAVCGRVVLTGDPCAPGSCPRPVACGAIRPFVRPDCRCPPDPRPLFAAPIRW